MFTLQTLSVQLKKATVCQGKLECFARKKRGKKLAVHGSSKMVVVCSNIVDVDNSWNERSKHLSVSSIVFCSVGKKVSSYRTVWKRYFL
jgi:hypothetical protein